MESYIEDYAVGYYNDDRVEAIRDLEKGGPLGDCKASHFLIIYYGVLPENVRRWRKRLSGGPLDKEEMRRLAADLRGADPIGWTDGQALDVLAGRFMEMVRDARCGTERDILIEMLRRCHPDVMPRMEELQIKEAADNIWFSEFLDKAELSEAGQADKG